MLQVLRARRERSDEEGFTLIELMVVVLIIAILLAIAIPTFLGARQRAQDRAAQSNLRNAFTAEKVFYTDNQAYTIDTGAGAIKSIEPSLTYLGDAVPTATGTVYTWTTTASSTDDTVVLGAKSASGKCFFLKDLATGNSAGTTYATDTATSPCVMKPSTASGFTGKW